MSMLDDFAGIVAVPIITWDNEEGIKLIDSRLALFSDDHAAAVIAEVGSGQEQRVQIRVDSQMLCNRIREKLQTAASKDGRQFQMTILGEGAAVEVTSLFVIGPPPPKRKAKRRKTK